MLDGVRSGGGGVTGRGAPSNVKPKLCAPSFFLLEEFEVFFCVFVCKNYLCILIFIIFIISLIFSSSAGWTILFYGACGRLVSGSAQNPIFSK